jgi:hypothetical protein
MSASGVNWKIAERVMNLGYVRNEIARIQHNEIEMLGRAGISTASAGLLLARMRAKVDDLFNRRAKLRVIAQGNGTR